MSSRKRGANSKSKKDVIEKDKTQETKKNKFTNNDFLGNLNQKKQNQLVRQMNQNEMDEVVAAPPRPEDKIVDRHHYIPFQVEILQLAKEDKPDAQESTSDDSEPSKKRKNSDNEDIPTKKHNTRSSKPSDSNSDLDSRSEEETPLVNKKQQHKVSSPRNDLLYDYDDEDANKENIENFKKKELKKEDSDIPSLMPSMEDDEIQWEDAMEGMQSDQESAQLDPPQYDNFTEETDESKNAVNVSIQFAEDESRPSRKGVTKNDRMYAVGIHKMNLLALLANRIYVDQNILSDSMLQSVALSTLPKDLITEISRRVTEEAVSSEIMKRLHDWFKSKYKIKQQNEIDLTEQFAKAHSISSVNTVENILQKITLGSPTQVEACYILLCICKALGLQTRFVSVLDPITFHVKIAEVNQKDTPEEKNNNNNSKDEFSIDIDTLDFHRGGFVTKKKEKPKTKTSKPLPLTPKKESETKHLPTKANARKVAKELQSMLPKDMFCWLALYSDKENKWIHMDCQKGFVAPEYFEKQYKKPLPYVLAIHQTKSCIRYRDVSFRYASRWQTTRQHRVDIDWWNATLAELTDVYTTQHGTEDFYKWQEIYDIESAELNSMEMQKTEQFPTSQDGFRFHPVYVLEKFITKYQIIHPKQPVGTFKNLPVYRRENVHDLHTLERWFQEGRVVKPNEQPLKQVKKRKLPGKKRDTEPAPAPGEAPLEGEMSSLFAEWQTEPYEPPTAENGMVPKNSFNSVYLFKPEMLPKGCTHLTVPYLSRVCKKLGIDYAPAVVSWEFINGKRLPKSDGIVVAEENAEVVMEAWDVEQADIEEKRRAKKEKAVLERWKRLVRKLLVRDAVMRKYGDKQDQEAVPKKEEPTDENNNNNVLQKKKKKQGPHQHQFLPEDIVSDEATGIKTKVCKCGFKITYEEL